MIFLFNEIQNHYLFYKKKNLYKIKIHDFKISSSNSKIFFYKNIYMIVWNNAHHLTFNQYKFLFPILRMLF